MASDPGFRKDLGGTFMHPGVAAAYQYRPPYPDEVFDVMERLIAGQPPTVLDVGTGDGALARPLAGRVGRVDALDVSAAMIAEGRRRPGGDRPNLRWRVGAAESADLDGPYGLVTAGVSLHWMAGERTLTRLAAAMSEGAFLVIADRDITGEPWRDEVLAVILRHTRNPVYNAGSSIADVLADRGLFEVAGRLTTEPVPFRQPAAEYVEHFHSTASLARELMPAAEADEIDRALTAAVRPHAAGGMLDMSLIAHLTWGWPAVRS